MKNLLTSALCFWLLTFIFSCQNNKDEALKPTRSAGAQARRACNNTVTYGILKPDNDYGYNGNGEVSYFLHRGVARQFKVKMANTSSAQAYINIRLDHPDGSIQYSVVSTTGGTTSTGSPVPNTSAGAYIVWEATVPAYTTYEMVFSLYTPVGSPGAENGIQLSLVNPCLGVNSGDPDQDDNMHVVVTD